MVVSNRIRRMRVYLFISLIIACNAIRAQSTIGVYNSDLIEERLLIDVVDGLSFFSTLNQYRDSTQSYYYERIVSYYQKANKGCHTAAEELKITKYAYYLEASAKYILNELSILDSLSKKEQINWLLEQIDAHLKMKWGLMRIFPKMDVVYYNQKVLDCSEEALIYISNNKSRDMIQGCKVQLVLSMQRFKEIIHFNNAVLSFDDYFSEVEPIQIE